MFCLCGFFFCIYEYVVVCVLECQIDPNLFFFFKIWPFRFSLPPVVLHTTNWKKTGKLFLNNIYCLVMSEGCTAVVKVLKLSKKKHRVSFHFEEVPLTRDLFSRCATWLTKTTQHTCVFVRKQFINATFQELWNVKIFDMRSSNNFQLPELFSFWHISEEPVLWFWKHPNTDITCQDFKILPC